MVGTIVTYNSFAICTVNNVCDHILWIRLDGRAISINTYILLITIYYLLFTLTVDAWETLTSIILNNTECGINFNLVLGELHKQSSEKYSFSIERKSKDNIVNSNGKKFVEVFKQCNMISMVDLEMIKIVGLHARKHVILIIVYSIPTF